MKNLRWQLVIIFITGIIVGVLLITQQPGGSVTSPSTPEPTEGGVYTEALIGSLVRLNPLVDYANQPDRDINRLVFSGLVRFDTRGLPLPDLAESWGISADGTIYNFSLRPGITWHDGQPLTAQDVLFTIELLRSAEDLVPADLVAFWKEIEVEQFNETTLQFRLPEAFAPFLDYLGFGILPQHILGDIPLSNLNEAPFNLAPVGSGPYRFDHLLVENEQIIGVVLSVNDDYYVQKPYIQQVVFRYYPDPAAALQAYQQGEVQGIGQVPSDILPQVLAETDLALYAGRQPELAMVLFNLENPEVDFFQDVAIRHALLAGINRQWLVDKIFQGQAILADGPLFPGTWAFYEGLERVEYDPDAATNVLKEAGFVLPAEGETVRSKEDRQFAFTLLVPDDDPRYITLAEAIQSDWAALGVKVELETLPYQALISERLEARNYQAALVSLNLSRTPDPDPYPFWDQAQAANGQNYTQWDDRNASEYMEQARVTTDLAERAKLYRNFQVIFSQELPALPLFYPVYNYAIDRQVQGVQMGALIEPSDRFSTIPEWYLVARRPAEEPTGSAP